MDTDRSAKYTPLVLAVLTAAVLQAILIARSPTISADGIIFTSIARDLHSAPITAFRKHDQHPGYPAAMLAATRTVQWLGYRAEPESWTIGGRAVSYLCGLLCVVVVWRFARDLYDAKVANISAFIFAVLPLPRLYGAEAQSDMPHTLFYLTAAWLATRAIKTDRLLPLAAAGVASAVAYWIRPEGLEVFVAAMLVVVWRGARTQWPWRRVGLAAGTLGAATLVAAAPYPILAGKITSKQLPFFKQQSAPTYIELMAEAKQPSEPPAEVAAAPPPLEETPTSNRPAVAEETTPMSEPAASEPDVRYTAGLVARLGARAVGKLIESLCYGFRYVFIPVYLLGQWEMVRRGTPQRIIVLLWTLASLHMVILLWVFYVSGYIASRHVLPLIGLAMPFTALGVLCIGEHLGRWFSIRPARVTVATLVVCTLIVLPYSMRAYNREFLPVIAATRWVEGNAAPGTGIVCNSPYVGYYGSLPTTILGPDAISLEDALAQGTAGVRYDFVVLHVGAHGYLPEWLPQIKQHYHQVLEYHDPTWTDRMRKVLVFESRAAQARRQANDSRS